MASISSVLDPCLSTGLRQPGAVSLVDGCGNRLTPGRNGSGPHAAAAGQRDAGRDRHGRGDSRDSRVVEGTREPLGYAMGQNARAAQVARALAAAAGCRSSTQLPQHQRRPPQAPLPLLLSHLSHDDDNDGNEDSEVSFPRLESDVRTLGVKRGGAGAETVPGDITARGLRSSTNRLSTARTSTVSVMSSDSLFGLDDLLPARDGRNEDGGIGTSIEPEVDAGLASSSWWGVSGWDQGAMAAGAGGQFESVAQQSRGISRGSGVHDDCERSMLYTASEQTGPGASAGERGGKGVQGIADDSEDENWDRNDVDPVQSLARIKWPDIDADRPATVDPSARNSRARVSDGTNNHSHGEAVSGFEPGLDDSSGASRRKHAPLRCKSFTSGSLAYHHYHPNHPKMHTMLPHPSRSSTRSYDLALLHANAIVDSNAIRMQGNIAAGAAEVGTSGTWQTQRARRPHTTDEHVWRRHSWNENREAGNPPLASLAYAGVMTSGWVSRETQRGSAGAKGHNQRKQQQQQYDQRRRRCPTHASVILRVPSCSAGETESSRRQIGSAYEKGIRANNRDRGGSDRTGNKFGVKNGSHAASGFKAPGNFRVAVEASVEALARVTVR